MAYSSGTLFYCSLTKEVYNPKAFFLHAALLGQACAHCPIFPTAASRRSLGRISVPMWPVTLSGRLPVNALVGHHPANKLIGRDPIPCRKKHFPPHHAVGRSIRYYHPFPGAIPVHRAGWSRITHPFATLTPTARPPGIPFDLHVLSTPPAFILSQNRTLHKKHCRKPKTTLKSISKEIRRTIQ